MHLIDWRKNLVILTILTQLSSVSTTFAEANKIPNKPVEPFYQQVSADAPRIYQPNVTYLSPLKQAPISFTSLGATWKQQLPAQTSLLIEVRFKSADQVSDWYHLDADLDDKSGEENHSTMTAFLTTNKSEGYQYRITLNSQDQTQTPVLDELKFTFIDGGTPEQKTDLLIAGHLSSANQTTSLEENEFLPDNAVSSESDLSTPVADLSTDSLVASTSLVGQAETLTILPDQLKGTIKTPVRPIKRASSPLSTSQVKIISRTEWGANESLRVFNPSETKTEPQLVKFEDDYYTKYANELKETKRITTDENGNLLTWPLTYPEAIKKIVIHHTATTKDLDDPMKAIRDIYYWHTMTKGWGDIGYNYIIDPKGNIYEGRFGGEMVVGAHAGRGNHGSIGIAVLGNYQDNDPPEAVITALTALVKAKARLYNIDTEGADLFRGEAYPNVMGHRDIMSTSCPGEKLYNMLPIIRKMAKVDNTAVSTNSNVNSDYNFAFNGSAPVFSYDPKGRKMLNLIIKNTGLKSWGANTYFQINPNQNSRLFLRNADQILSGKVGREIKPGETASIDMLTFATATSGSGLIQIFPIIDGTNKQERYLSFGVQVKTPTPQLKYDYELVSLIYSKNEFQKGDLVDVTVKLRNKGVSPWMKVGDNRLQIGSDKPRDHKNILLEKPSARLSSMDEDIVQADQIGTFHFHLKVPNTDGIYREFFTPVIEGIQWMTNHNTFIQIKVGNSDQLVTPDLGDAEGDVPPAPSFLKPATQGQGRPESIIKFDRSTTTNSVIPSTTSTTTASNPTPLGGSTVNIATTALDLTSPLRPIRVDLAYRGNPATISADGDFSLYEGARFIQSYQSDEKVVLEYKNSAFLITSTKGNYNLGARIRFVPKTGTIMRIDNWERRNEWGDHANNNEFRGVLEAIIYSNELHFVNELPLEDYLKGLAEESSSEPDEKIKAIMIIARTYSRFYMEVAKKFPGAPFDLNDDPNYSQKYTGYSFEKRSAKTAQMATATAGKYVTYQGKLIKTPFFSKSDGKRTISAKDKWGWTDTPFLTSVDDSLCVSTAFSGHGVGLSGCGATAMAKLGKSFEEIIKYYYQGTEITQANN